jgi:VanZ family protein
MQKTTGKTMVQFNTVRAWLWRWLPAVVMMVLIFTASSLPSKDVPSFGVWDLLAKKGGHALGYALLGAAYARGLSAGRRLSWRLAALALAGAVLYAITDEFHQVFVSGRHASPVDVLIDSGGAVAGIATWAFIQTRVRPAWLRPPSTPQ